MELYTQITIDSKELLPVIMETFAQNRSVRLQIAGNSMRPLWKHQRDSVRLVNCEPESLKKWDVVLYQRENGKIVLHRIVASFANKFSTCGDAIFGIENEIKNHQIIAKVGSFVRKGREISCNHIFYRGYVFLWYSIFPLRHLHYRAKNKLKSIKNQKT